VYVLTTTALLDGAPAAEATGSSSSKTSGSAGWVGTDSRGGIGSGMTSTDGGCSGGWVGGTDAAAGRTNGSSRQGALQSGQRRWPYATLAEMQWKWNVWEHSAMKMACPPPTPMPLRQIAQRFICKENKCRGSFIYSSY
jgi:hypothetical protein